MVIVWLIQKSRKWMLLLSLFKASGSKNGSKKADMLINKGLLV